MFTSQRPKPARPRVGPGGIVSRVNTPTAPDAGHAASWLPAFGANAVIWGASFLFIKYGVLEAPAMWVGAGRVLLGALTLIVIMLAVRERLPRDPKMWA